MSKHVRGQRDWTNSESALDPSVLLNTNKEHKSRLRVYLWFVTCKIFYHQDMDFKFSLDYKPTGIYDMDLSPFEG